MSLTAERRLQRELKNMIEHPDPGIHLDKESAEQNILIWYVKIDSFEGTLYDGDRYELRFVFNHRYPFESPQVTFVGDAIPVHPHVYSNGHICLSIFADDWSPALSVRSVCHSIISLLGSCHEKEPPLNDRAYVSTCHRDPRKTHWMYHDDHC